MLHTCLCAVSFSNRHVLYHVLVCVGHIYTQVKWGKILQLYSCPKRALHKKRGNGRHQQCVLRMKNATLFRNNLGFILSSQPGRLLNPISSVQLSSILASLLSHCRGMHSNTVNEVVLHCVNILCQCNGLTLSLVLCTIHTGGDDTCTELCNGC